MLATERKIRFTVDEYFKMSAAGVFDDRRVELIALARAQGMISLTAESGEARE